MSELLRVLEEQKIVAIVRGIEARHQDETAEALLNGGIQLLEMTLNTPGALEAIARWRERFGERARIGAGTVLNTGMARDAIAAGAQYLIAPNLDEDVVALGVDNGVDVCPGP
jgi:2-dehydro-3-deoxyphosphogluconate aldolase/(4S)-4-hydroxy-2-oxoglutarate aldolase